MTCICSRRVTQLVANASLILYMRSTCVSELHGGEHVKIALPAHVMHVVHPALEGAFLTCMMSCFCVHALGDVGKYRLLQCMARISPTLASAAATAVMLHLYLKPRKMIRNVTTCAHFSLASGCVCDPQGEKMRELAWFVTHLKAVKGDKHAIKNFDRELECKNCCFAKAAGVEAVVPCK